MQLSQRAKSIALAVIILQLFTTAAAAQSGIIKFDLESGPPAPTLVLTPVRAGLILTPVISSRARSKAALRSTQTRAKRSSSVKTSGESSSLSETQRIVCEVFGPHCARAMQVTKRECRTGSPSCSNGQYQGVMQMGSRERAKYGHGSTVREQAEAAKRYHDEAGWGPWE